MTDESLLYLRRLNVQALGITTHDIVATIGNLLRQVDAGTAWNTPKAQILPGQSRLYMSMLASATEPPLMAVKSLGKNPANPEKGQETIGALITVPDSESGLPLGIMDSDRTTGVRTAALSATEAHHLGRKNAETIARTDRVVIDDAKQEKTMADLMVPQELIAGDLKGLATGTIPDRQSDQECGVSDGTGRLCDVGQLMDSTAYIRSGARLVEMTSNGAQGREHAPQVIRSDHRPDVRNWRGDGRHGPIVRLAARRCDPNQLTPSALRIGWDGYVTPSFHEPERRRLGMHPDQVVEDTELGQRQIVPHGMF
ncbi:MAG: hypothetical protein GDA49_12840 [Rhodospirillales bacterium]|nr:hypothetical protein [Rhodospirillales bacterium]